MQAAHAAFRLRDLEGAEQFARAAIRCTGDLNAARGLLAKILENEGRHRESMDELDLAESEMTTIDARHEWALLYAANSLFVGSSRQQAIAMMNRFEAPAGHEGEAAATQSWTELFDGQVVAASKTAFTVLDDPQSSAVAIVWAGVAGATASSLSGDAMRADLDLAAAVERFRRGGVALPFAEMQVGIATVITQIMTGQWAQALKSSEEVWSSAKEGNEPPEVLGGIASVHSLAFKEAGRLVEANQWLCESVRLLGEMDPYQFRSFTFSEQSACLAVLGNREDALSCVARASACEPGGRLFTGLKLRNQAWVHAAHNELGRAAACLEEAVEEGSRCGQTIIELLAHVDLARLLKRRFSVANHRHLSKADQPTSRLLIEAAEAFSSNSAMQCVAVSRRLTAAGSFFLASEAAIAASLLDPTTSSFAFAKSDTQSLNWCTPLRKRARATPLSLTPREAELARLVRFGMSSPKIAKELGISVRTVDNQLGRVYRKLGVTGRKDLLK